MVRHSQHPAHLTSVCVNVEVPCPLFASTGSCDGCAGKIKRGVRRSHLGLNSDYILRSLGELGGLKRAHGAENATVNGKAATSVASPAHPKALLPAPPPMWSPNRPTTLLTRPPRRNLTSPAVSDDEEEQPSSAVSS
eukprot:gene431-567_t